MQQILDTLGFNWQMALFSIFNFLVVFALLQKFLFSKMIKTLEERKQLINQSITNAEKVETQLKEANVEADSILSEAKKQANQIILEGRNEAKEVAAKVKSDTQNEIDQMLEKSRNQIELEKAQSLKSLRGEISELVMIGTEKLTKEKVSTQEGEESVKGLLKEIN